jgi:pyrroloquinoline quinone biosynthesis protein B
MLTRLLLCVCYCSCCFMLLAQSTFIEVLGIAQDAGYPQADCQKKCCSALWAEGVKGARVACIGIVDEKKGESWMVDATPDFPQQLHQLSKAAPLGGILLTHAHIGHYTGLMHLGREAIGAKEVPVYVMPRMYTFLQQNGPWSQLVSLDNIQLQPLYADSAVVLGDQLTITPLQVPHRDEFSETVGFLIQSAQKAALYIPDIDKWHLWKQDILKLIRQVDYALLDATFYENGEIPNRDISEIPHPFVEESMALFSTLDKENRAKVYFIHFNHTNPLLQNESKAKQKVEAAGFHIAEEGLRLSLD